MKTRLIVLTLVAFAACMIPSTFATQGVVYGYTIHVDFFAYSCSLSVTQVSLFDSSGTLLGEMSSPYGAEVAVPVITSAPISALTASAYGVATLDSIYTWHVTGSTSITLGSTGDYWITIRMS